MKSPETPKPGSQQQVVMPLCEGYYGMGTKCRITAVLAVIENGDYVPVCAYHSNVARQQGWKLGILRHNEKGQR